MFITSFADDSVRRCRSSCAGLAEEVGNRHSFVAMWAWSSGAKTTHKNSAVVTPLLTEGAGFTLWALVHDGRLWQAGGQPETDLI